MFWPAWIWIALSLAGAFSAIVVLIGAVAIVALPWEE